MRADTLQVFPGLSVESGRHWRFWRNALAGMAFAAALASLAQDGRPAANPAPPTQASSNAAAQVPPNAAKMTKQDQAASADTDRKKQITDESAQLLNMALALKAEVDKTSKDTLSLNVIRKADEIEKLAHSVKEKIKQSAGPG